MSYLGKFPQNLTPVALASGVSAGLENLASAFEGVSRSGTG